MKIKLYIVTYKANDLLKRCVDSVGEHDDLDVFAINNYGVISDTFLPVEVVVLNNVCRPDWSTGHLARSWNQALLLGFRDLDKPDADIVCACQDDTVFKPGWVDALIEHHKDLDFVQFGHGDNFMSWTPEGVKHIGMWDEGFCGLNYHEADYFVRARKSASCTINDKITGHSRVFNPRENDIIEDIKPGFRTAHKAKKEIKGQSFSTNKMNKAFFAEKWGDAMYASDWAGIEEFPEPKFGCRTTYPYFEKAIKGAQ